MAPVLVAVDQVHNEMDFILNAVTSENIDQVLAPRLASQCVLCTDAPSAHNPLCEQHHILHKVSQNLQTAEGGFHISDSKYKRPPQSIKKWDKTASWRRDKIFGALFRVV